MTAQVALLFFCDTLNCAFDITFLYLPLVNGFGKSYNVQRLCSVSHLHVGDIVGLNYASWVFATGAYACILDNGVFLLIPMW